MNRIFDRRRFLKASGLALASAALPGCGESFRRAGNSRPRKQPNIVLIMADDMGYSDLGCYGGEVETPNLDRLASDGLRFTQFYNAARCCPTRAALLTGLYPHQAGVGGMVTNAVDTRPPGPYAGYLNDNCVTIAEVLGESGYTTVMSGKWHVGESRPHWPVDRGFDKFWGLVSGGGNYFDITKGKQKGIVRIMADDDKRYYPPKEGFYMTEAISDHAIGMLDHCHQQDKPFFLYVGYTAPHWPLHALPEDIEKYRGKYMGGWDKLRRQRYARMVKMGLIDEKWPLSQRDEKVKPWDEVNNKEEMDLKMAVYAAQIDRMDQGIGRILSKLKQIGAEDDTLVMFLSDNGACHEGGLNGFDRRNNGLPPGGVDSYMSYGRSWANACNTPFRLFKHWVHEGGAATPLIVRWPGVVKAKGRITHEVGHVIDIMATCCDVAGVKYPETYKDNAIKPLEGKSLLPVLKGRSRAGHDVIYWEHFGNRAIRRGNWKLVAENKKQWKLYNLKDDRTELIDLTEKHPAKVEELKKLYRAWAKKCKVR